MILPYANKQLRNIDAWIGKNYDTTVPSLLILGESSWGSTPPLPKYLPDVIAERAADTFFTAVYNACSASKSPPFKSFSKQGFWDAVAFYNFVPGSVGLTHSKRPSVSALKSGIRPLHLLLEVLRPHGVFIVGLTHSYYSRPIVHAHGIPYVVIPHPRSGVSSPFITQSFDVLVRISTP